MKKYSSILIKSSMWAGLTLLTGGFIAAYHNTNDSNFTNLIDGVSSEPDTLEAMLDSDSLSISAQIYNKDEVEQIAEVYITVRDILEIKQVNIYRDGELERTLIEPKTLSPVISGTLREMQVKEVIDIPNTLLYDSINLVEYDSGTHNYSFEVISSDGRSRRTLGELEITYSVQEDLNPSVKIFALDGNLNEDKRNYEINIMGFGDNGGFKSGEVYYNGLRIRGLHYQELNLLDRSERLQVSFSAENPMSGNISVSLMDEGGNEFISKPFLTSFNQ